jgi:hypothetical protein
MRNLVDDWKRGHKWVSTRLLVPAGALDGVAILMRSERPTCEPGLPHDLHMAAWVLLWGVLIGRFYKQKH